MMATLLAAFAIIPNLFHFANAATATPTFKVVGTSTLIVPPAYGAGQATYYASPMSMNSLGTTYAITCVPPTTRVTHSDPCKTAAYGTDVQYFVQGPKTWDYIRKDVTATASGLAPGISIYCTPSVLPPRSCDALPTPMSCAVNYQSSTARFQQDMCTMGLKQAKVLMVDSLSIPTATTNRLTTDDASFTDIGRTEAPNVATVTLYAKPEPENSGTKRREAKMGVVGLAMAAAGGLALG